MKQRPWHRRRRVSSGLWLLAVALVGGSLVPIPGLVPETEPTGTVGITTLLHITGYGLLAAGGVWEAEQRQWLAASSRPWLVRLGCVVGLVSLFGVGTELLQAAVPWRFCGVEDMAVNAASAVGGGLLGSWIAATQAASRR